MFVNVIVLVLLVTMAVAMPVAALDTFVATLRSRVRIPEIVFLAAVATIVLGGHATFTIVDAAFASRTKLHGFESAFPIKLLGYRDAFHLAPSVGTELLAIAIVQSLALAIVAVAMLRVTRARAIAVAAGASVAMIEALVAHVGTSGDAFSNVGYALLGMRSYVPPSVAFTGTFAPISQWWGTPIVPAPYGPLWIVALPLLTGAGPTLLAKVLLLRFFGAVSLVAIVVLFRALRFSAATLAVAALNPALVFEFVANVHNDLFAVALLLGSRLACRRRRPGVGIALAICAGLIKLPFALFAVTSFDSIAGRRMRIVALCATLAATVMLSYAFTGGALFAGIAHHLSEHVSGNGVAALFSFSIFSIARFAAVIGLIALAVTSFWSEGIVSRSR